jgi:hypothetical protein
MIAGKRYERGKKMKWQTLNCQNYMFVTNALEGSVKCDTQIEEESKKNSLKNNTCQSLPHYSNEVVDIDQRHMVRCYWLREN